ncbi:MAG: ankyrin repeat domain-containing protein [Flavobacteriales bacterium]|nr:ankyrin repeat domain-containing protein [Flavobacteriales bacterium]
MKKILVASALLFHLNSIAQETTLTLEQRIEAVPAKEKNAEAIIKHGISTNDLELFKHGVGLAGKDLKKVKYTFSNIHINKGSMFIGATPLIHAASMGQLEMVKILIENKVNVNADCNSPIYTDDIEGVNHSGKMKGLTAMHMAAQRGHKEIVQALVDAGSDFMTLFVEIEPGPGARGISATARQWAKVHGQTEVEELLKSAKGSSMKQMWNSGGMK